MVSRIVLYGTQSVLLEFPACRHESRLSSRSRAYTMQDRVQHLTSAVKVTLPAFAAECRAVAPLLLSARATCML